MSANVDLRKFKYALSPLVKRTNWELDHLRLELARANKTLKQTKSALQERSEKLEEYMNQMRHSWNTTLNIELHRHALTYFQNEKIAITNIQSAIDEQEFLLSELRKKCIAHHHKLEVFDSHEDNLRQEFILEQSNIMNAETDREWNARREWNKVKEGSGT